jgi:hypothetical protein
MLKKYLACFCNNSDPAQKRPYLFLSMIAREKGYKNLMLPNVYKME